MPAASIIPIDTARRFFGPAGPACFADFTSDELLLPFFKVKSCRPDSYSLWNELLS